MNEEYLKYFKKNEASCTKVIKQVFKLKKVMKNSTKYKVIKSYKHKLIKAEQLPK